jgi:RES domain-containing protein
MNAWRIGKRPHPVFDGGGALQFGGRWNSPGRPVIYAASTFALAVLEVLAHAQLGKTPPGLMTVEIDIPKRVRIEVLDRDTLPGWDAPDYACARAFGDRWLAEARTAVLAVPSVLSPTERNIAINPRHAAFRQIKPGPETAFTLEARLARLIEGG